MTHHTQKRGIIEWGRSRPSYDPIHLSHDLENAICPLIIPSALFPRSEYKACCNHCFGRWPRPPSRRFIIISVGSLICRTALADYEASCLNMPSSSLLVRAYLLGCCKGVGQVHLFLNHMTSKIMCVLC